MLSDAVRRRREGRLTWQHTNHTVLVEGLEITIRPVSTRRLMAGGSRWNCVTAAIRISARLRP